MPKILIADNTAFMRRMIKTTLMQNGYNDLVEASDGVEALEKYDAEKPDLVLLDLAIPVMDGLEVLREIRRRDPGAVVVIFSAMGQEALVIEAIQSGAKDFIVKPVQPERVLQTVRKILG